MLHARVATNGGRQRGSGRGGKTKGRVVGAGVVSRRVGSVKGRENSWGWMIDREGIYKHVGENSHDTRVSLGKGCRYAAHAV